MAYEKTYRKFIPVSDYDIVGMETWLSDMANKGFFLYDLGYFFAQFTNQNQRPSDTAWSPPGRTRAIPAWS